MKKLLLIFIILLAVTSFISAATIIEFIGDEGLEIKANVQPYYKVNEGAEVYIWVFNKTTGSVLTSTDVSCEVQLTNHNGTVVLSGNPTGEDNHFRMSRVPSVVNSIESYALTIVCNNSDIAGYQTSFFDATYTGYPLTQEKTILYIGLLGIMVLLFVINVSAIPMLPSGDNRDEDGKLISINQLKYIKPILYTTAYLFLMSIVYLGSNIALAHLESELFGNLLFNIFYIMMALALPFIVIWFIYVVVRVFQDKQMQRYIERGVE